MSDVLDGLRPSRSEWFHDGRRRRRSPCSRVLVAVADPVIAASLCAELRERGFAAISARHAGEVLQVLEQALDGARAPVDLLLADDRLPILGGRELVHDLRRAGLPLEYVVLGWDGACRSREQLAGVATLLQEWYGAAADLRLGHSFRSTPPSLAGEE